jgi:hypothetical protein
VERSPLSSAPSVRRGMRQSIGQAAATQRWTVSPQGEIRESSQPPPPEPATGRCHLPSVSLSAGMTPGDGDCQRGPSAMIVRAQCPSISRGKRSPYQNVAGCRVVEAELPQIAADPEGHVDAAASRSPGCGDGTCKDWPRRVDAPPGSTELEPVGKPLGTTERWFRNLPQTQVVMTSDPDQEHVPRYRASRGLGGRRAEEERSGDAKGDRHKQRMMHGPATLPTPRPTRLPWAMRARSCLTPDLQPAET